MQVLLKNTRHQLNYAYVHQRWCHLSNSTASHDNKAEFLWQKNREGREFHDSFFGKNILERPVFYDATIPSWIYKLLPRYTLLR